jgi:regulator of sigma E protease
VSGSAAEKAGIQKGDLIVKIDGSAVKEFSDIQQAVVARAGDTLSMVVERSGTELELSVTPETREEPDGFGGKIKVGRLGIQANSSAGSSYTRLGPVDALRAGGRQTWFIVETTMRYVGKMFTGRESPEQLSGVIGMATAAGNAASMGFYSFVNIIAFLSVSIGLINLFPIPMLDGGHLVYYAIEAVRGRPLGEAAQEWGFRIGLSIVVLLMVVGTWNDLTRQFFGG